MGVVRKMTHIQSSKSEFGDRKTGVLHEFREFMRIFNAKTQSRNQMIFNHGWTQINTDFLRKGTKGENEGKRFDASGPARQ
jgi:hypothetical protein